MFLCKKIKIEVNQHDVEALEFMQAKCRGLYNWWVVKLRSGERWNLEQAKRSLRESKQYDPELRAVYGKLLAEVISGTMRCMGSTVACWQERNLASPGSGRVISSLPSTIQRCIWKCRTGLSCSLQAEVATGDQNAMRTS